MTRRIGVHLGTAGGPSNAVVRAREIGANTLQIFSSSPRMWRTATIDPVQAERVHESRAKYNIGPLAIHTSYLLNVCSQTEEVREKSILGLRGEIEGESPVRALQVLRRDGSACVVSLQRFHGKLGRRRGTFVLQGAETVEQGSIKARWFVVPGSGTGELAGLRGEGGFEGAFGKGSEGWLEYWFE